MRLRALADMLLEKQTSKDMNRAKLLIGIGFLILGINISSAQTWAPIGAKWSYTLRFAFSGEVDTLVVRSTGDTIIQGKQCRILKKNITTCDERGIYEYMYSDSGKVFFFDNSRSKFQMLFNINAKIADTWIWKIKDFPSQDSVVVIVDSISTITINSIIYKKIFVEYVNVTLPWSISGNGRIIENMGDDYYLFPWVSGICDITFGGPLRCYQDSIMGHFETGVVSNCNYRTVGLNEKSKSEIVISIYPNPTRNTFSIILDETEPFNSKQVEITNLLGVRIFLGTFSTNKYSIDLTNQPDGVYFISIKLDGKSVYYKILKQK